MYASGGLLTKGDVAKESTLAAAAAALCAGLPHAPRPELPELPAYVSHTYKSGACVALAEVAKRSAADPDNDNLQLDVLAVSAHVARLYQPPPSQSVTQSATQQRAPALPPPPPGLAALYEAADFSAKAVLDPNFHARARASGHAGVFKKQLHAHALTVGGRTARRTAHNWQRSHLHKVDQVADATSQLLLGGEVHPTSARRWERAEAAEGAAQQRDGVGRGPHGEHTRLPAPKSRRPPRVRVVPPASVAPASVAPESTAPAVDATVPAVARDDDANSMRE